MLAKSVLVVVLLSVVVEIDVVLIVVSNLELDNSDRAKLESNSFIGVIGAAAAAAEVSVFLVFSCELLLAFNVEVKDEDDDVDA